MQSFGQPSAPQSHGLGRCQTGIDKLEQRAFLRGLPDSDRADCKADSGHAGLNNRRNAGGSEPAGLRKTAPVILLIDDEETFRAALRQFLSRAGYDVVEAANGLEAIKSFRERPADMVITDIIMPEKEGIETLIELRQDLPDVKMIAMSGGGWYGTEIDFDMAKKLGARTLDKPFTLQELLDMVQELLN
jgi:CheY-like chemotaxis protein